MYVCVCMCVCVCVCVYSREHIWKVKENFINIHIGVYEIFTTFTSQQNILLQKFI